MYYFCSPVKASIKSIKPFQHVILTGSCSRPLAFFFAKSWSLMMGSWHPESSHTKRMSLSEWEQGYRTPPVLTHLPSWLQPKLSLNSHLASCMDWCCPTHRGNSCVWKQGAASPCGFQPSTQGDTKRQIFTYPCSSPAGHRCLSECHQWQFPPHVLFL